MFSAIFYYKDIPWCLYAYLTDNKTASLTKEGLGTFEGVRCARAVITLETDEPSADKLKLAKLVKLLEILESNHEIIAFSVKY